MRTALNLAHLHFHYFFVDHPIALKIERTDIRQVFRKKNRPFPAEQLPHISQKRNAVIILRLSEIALFHVVKMKPAAAKQIIHCSFPPPGFPAIILILAESGSKEKHQ